MHHQQPVDIALVEKLDSRRDVKVNLAPEQARMLLDVGIPLLEADVSGPQATRSQHHVDAIPPKLG
jgi:hypothetical protein